MESHKVRPSTKVSALRDEYFFDEREIVDNDTGHRAQIYTKYVTIDATEGGERLKGRRVLSEQM